AHVLPTDLAYAPVIEAFGRALRNVDGYSRTQLTRGLPDLGLLFPDLGAEPPPDLGDPGLARARLFDAVSQLLGRLARHQAVLLMIDDLHAADAASRDLISYLCRSIAEWPAVVLLTRRPTGDLPIPLVAERTVEIELGLLPPAETEVLVGNEIGGEPDPDVVAAIARRAGGVPFYVQTLAAHVAE